MKRHIKTYLLLFFGLFSQQLIVAQSVYVSPNGNDNAVGSINAPFTSLEKAISFANSNPKITEIILREGTYILNTPLSIERSNLTIKAFSDENPQIIGGSFLPNNWQKDGNGRWKMQVPTYFRQLFVDEKRAIRARFPNEGKWADQWFQPDTIDILNKRMVLNHGFPASFSKIKNAEMYATAWWHWLRQKVAKFDPDKKTIFTVTEPSPECSSRKIDFIDRIYFENDIAFLDTENEWFLDSLTHTLYFQSFENPNKKRFIYPINEQLLFIKGTAEKPLSNIKIEGVKFSYTEWNMPPEERKSIQAGFWGTQHGKPVFAPPAAVMLFWADKCVISKCFFTNLGEGAIALGDGCHDNKIESNRFDDIGSNVIQIGWRTNYIGKGKVNETDINNHPLYFSYEKPSAIPINNVVYNNHLKNFCTTDRSGVGIWVGNDSNTTITNNLLEDFTYSGISVGWRWDTLANTARNNIIQWNEIRNGMQYMSDGGGIYTAGRQEGTKILNNWVYDIGGGPALGEGIYNDEGGSYFEIAYNYVERTKSQAFKFHKNLWNTINIHDNNASKGKNVITQHKSKKNVGDMLTNDISPSITNIYGLLKNDEIVLKNIEFERGRYDLKANSYPDLIRLANMLNENPNIIIEISGHTSNEGDPAQNKILSLNRAEASKQYLVSKGIEAYRIKTIGFGSEKMIDLNNTEEGRMKNRRIEFRITKY